MKLFWFILPIIQAVSSDSIIHCYLCDLPTPRSPLINTADYTCKYWSDFCNSDLELCGIKSTLNNNNNNYNFNFKCYTKNECKQFSDSNTTTGGVYLDCCDSNLCNNQKLLDDIFKRRNLSDEHITYNITENAITNSTENSEAVIQQLLYDIKFENFNDLTSIKDVFFTEENKKLLLLAKYDGNTKKLSSNYKNKFANKVKSNEIIYVDLATKEIKSLLYNVMGITNVIFNAEHNILACKSHNNVIIYKLDKNKLTEVNKIYNKHDPIDISLNYDASIIAVSYKRYIKFYHAVKRNKPFYIKSYEDQGSDPMDNIVEVVSATFSPTQPLLVVLDRRRDMENLFTLGIFVISKDNKMKYLSQLPIKMHTVAYSKIAITAEQQQIITYTNDPRQNHVHFLRYAWGIDGNYRFFITQKNNEFNANYIDDIDDYTTDNDKEILAFIKIRLNKLPLVYIVDLSRKEINGSISNDQKILASKEIPIKASIVKLNNNEEDKQLVIAWENGLQIYSVNLPETQGLRQPSLLPYYNIQDFDNLNSTESTESTEITNNYTSSMLDSHHATNQASDFDSSYYLLMSIVLLIQNFIR